MWYNVNAYGNDNSNDTDYYGVSHMQPFFLVVLSWYNVNAYGNDNCNVYANNNANAYVNTEANAGVNA